MPTITTLAMVHPTPLLLAATGFMSGMALETIRASYSKYVPEFSNRDLTVQGRVTDVEPALYGQNNITVRVSQVWGLNKEPANFIVKVNIPTGDEIAMGSEIVLRVKLREISNKKHPPVIKATMAGGGSIPGSLQQSAVLRGRERLLEALGQLPDNSASAFLGAISLGERWRIDSWTREIFRKTGTYHLIAISGVHVGAAILPFLFLLRLFTAASQRIKPRTFRAVLLIVSMLAIGTYMCFTGLSASALRAAIYFILVGAAVLAGRSSSSLVSLAWCIILITCFSAGQQPDMALVLSTLAVTGIILSSKGQCGVNGRKFFKGGVRITLAAFLFTLPLTVWLAGGISNIALAGNIAVGVPFGLILIPAAVLIDYAALTPCLPLETILALWLRVADIVLGYTAYLADFTFSFQRLSSAGCLVPSLSAFCGILVWRQKKYHLGVGVVVFLLVLTVSFAGQLIIENINRDDLIIRFPEVGQADAAIIRKDGYTVLIDCGPSALPGRDSPVARALQRLGVRKIDALFLSHLHPDHTGALGDLIARWPVREIFLPEGTDDWRTWEDRLDNLNTDKEVRFLKYGDVVKISSMLFTVVGPEETARSRLDSNRRSMQVLLDVDGFRALFTGDAGWDQVVRSLGSIGSLDLLKIPHHGSKSGFPPTGLDDLVVRQFRNCDVIAVCPSRPPGNRHLPSPEVVKWFGERGIKLVYTGDNGVNIKYNRSRTIGDGSTVVDNHHRF